MAANRRTPDWTIREYNQWLRDPAYFDFGILHVRTLNLSSSRLRVLSERIRELGQLREIRLTDNQLRSLPESIRFLANLRVLNVKNNLLSLLPDSIGRLRQLETLNVENNLLEVLPTSIGNLTQLESLALDSNVLTVLPPQIGNLTELGLLTLNDNQLTVLPESIGNLTNLEQLYMSNNQLTALPDSIGNLTNLEELSVSDNQLSALPESIGHLVNLSRLEINRNDLTTLPESIINLRQLVTLIVDRNIAVPPELTHALEVHNNSVNRNDNNIAIPTTNASSNIRNQTSYNLLELENTPIRDLLAAPDILIVKSGSSYFTQYKSQIAAGMSSGSNIRFKCKRELRGAPSEDDIEPARYFYIQGPGNFLVKEAVLKSAMNKFKVIELLESDVRLDHVASYSSVQRSSGIGLDGRPVSIVSADHCQDGTAQKLYDIRGLNISEGGRRHVTKRQQRKRQQQKRKHTTRRRKN